MTIMEDMLGQTTFAKDMVKHFRLLPQATDNPCTRIYKTWLLRLFCVQLMLAMSSIPSSHMTIAKVFLLQAQHLSKPSSLLTKSSMKHGLKMVCASRFAQSSTPLHRGLRSSEEKIIQAEASSLRTEPSLSSAHSGSAPRSRRQMATLWIRSQSGSNTKIAVCSMRTLTQKTENSGTEHKKEAFSTFVCNAVKAVLPRRHTNNVFQFSRH